MAQILVIEDETDIQAVLEYNLTQAGHHVLLASTGKEGLRIAREARPDLCLLDLMLPDMPGTEICRTLKQDAITRNMRVIMLTARGEEIDRVVGFELGADDYVVKPFSTRELLLRLSAVLRRSEPPAKKIEGDVDFGTLKMDRTAHRAWVLGEEILLTALEFRLLSVLYDRRNRVQTRDTLLDDVWGSDVVVTSRTVDTHVKRLREKLGAAGAYIQTVRGVGYRFAASPDEVDA